MAENRTGGIVQQLASPQSVAYAKRRLEAIQLRIEGHGYVEIARRLGVGLARAHGYITSALAEFREQVPEAIEEVRQVELARLDAILEAHWAQRADVRHAQTLLNVMERRAKLLGLDLAIPYLPLPQGAGEVDLSSLTIDELAALEALLEKASARPPGLAIATVAAPMEDFPE